MIPFTQLPDGHLFKVSNLTTVYKRISADEICIHGLPQHSWLSKQRITPIPNLLVQPASNDSTRVESGSYETSTVTQKSRPSVTRTIPKRAAVKRSIPKRKEGAQ